MNSLSVGVSLGTSLVNSLSKFEVSVLPSYLKYLKQNKIKSCCYYKKDVNEKIKKGCC
jgi:hypothetical protein